MCIIKRKLEFEEYKNYSEPGQVENEINHLEKNIIDMDSLKEDHKEFIKNKKFILKAQQRFTRQKHNVFIEEINEILLR